MPSTRRWTNGTQPQTLQVAVFLLYANAVFALLDLLRGPGALSDPVLVAYFGVVIAGGVFAGLGIANERKLGYLGGIVAAVAPFAVSFYLFHNPFNTNLLNLLFEVALVALLLHPQSRDYQRIWFK